MYATFLNLYILTMKYIFSLVAIAMFSFVSNAQFSVVNGQAMVYDFDRNAGLAVDYIDGMYAVVFHDTDTPIHNTGGEYRLIVDGSYVKLDGVGAGGSWVAMDALDRDVNTAISMLRKGNKVTLQVCVGTYCETILTAGLSGSDRAIRAVTPLRPY